MYMFVAADNPATQAKADAIAQTAAD
jgi:hypothetical protein